MKLERIYNAKKSVRTGIVYKLLTHIMPFLVQTALIHGMGMQYVGLQGVFSSILSVLNVAELGIGSAVIYSMYGPIATDNKAEICALLSYYKKVYRNIGCIILILGIIVLPFVGFITGNLKEINVYVVFGLYLLNSVLSYFLYAYKSSILISHQRTDVSNRVGIFICIGMSLLQIMAIMVCKNFYLHLIIALVFTILSNLITSRKVDKIYPEYFCGGELTEVKHLELKKNVRGLMIAKVCGVSRNMFDSIFVSAFFGIVLAGIYSNYLYVFNAVAALLAVLSPSIIGGVGNSIKLENVEKNYIDMLRIDYVYMIVAGWCTVALLCLYQPFMEIWIGAENIFSFEIVALFSLYFYITQMGNVRAIYSDAAGLFWENRYRTLLEAVANIVLNYVLVKTWGVVGILIATIFTLFFIGFLGSAEVIFRCFFKSGIKKYLLNHLKYLCATFLTAIITYWFCSMIQGKIVVVFCARIIICAVVPAFMYAGIYHRSKLFKDLCEWVRGVH